MFRYDVTEYRTQVCNTVTTAVTGLQGYIASVNISIQRNTQQIIQQVGPRGARPHITMCMCMHMHMHMCMHMSETTATFLA